MLQARGWRAARGLLGFGKAEIAPNGSIQSSTKRFHVDRLELSRRKAAKLLIYRVEFRTWKRAKKMEAMFHLQVSNLEQRRDRTVWA